MLSHYDYSTCFVFSSLDNGWGILSDHGSIYEHNWTLYEPIMAAVYCNTFVDHGRPRMWPKYLMKFKLLPTQLLFLSWQ